MPDEVPGSTGPTSTGPGSAAGLPGHPALVGPICRAAPTRLAVSDSDHARSRRWLVIGSIVVAALLAGASVALAEAGSTPAPPAHAVGTTTQVGSIEPVGSTGPVAGW
jgi:hypothetical protein